MKLSNRLSAVAELVEKSDNVADVGCDHAYLSIYLAENDLCNNIIATEVNEGPYNIAINNIKKYELDNKIKIYLTDGLMGIEESLNTIVFAGMGATTIINILKNYKYLDNINKLIIQSNNDLELLRRYLNANGFYISREVYINENKKDYITILAIKMNKMNSKEELIMGVYNHLNKDFYLNQKNKIKDILKKIPNTDDINYQKNKEKLDILKKYIS